MDQAISRSRGKVAGVFTIYFALNGLITFLLYFIRVVPNGGIPVANLIRIAWVVYVFPRFPKCCLFFHKYRRKC